MQHLPLKLLILIIFISCLGACKAPQYAVNDRINRIYTPFEHSLLTQLPSSLAPVYYPDFLSKDTLNIVLYGINHPFFPEDNMGMKTFGYNLSHLSPHFDVAFAFHTGQQLKLTLIALTELGYVLGNVCIAGHSGYYGFFVEDGAGFYVNNYVYRKNRRVVPFKEGAFFIRELEDAIAQDSIRLSSNGMWVLAGCNTSSKNPSFADEMVRITGRSAISANQKVDLFNVPIVGLYLRGTEQGTFYVHEWNENIQKVNQLNMESSSIQIDKALDAYKLYKHHELK